MWHKFRRFGVVLVLNIIWTFVIVALVDFVITASYFHRHALSYKTDKITCSRALTGYGYCPSITQFLFMDMRDRIFPVINFIDSDGRSAYKNSKKHSEVANKGDIFVLGDSFIQADELFIEERFEHFLREDGYNVAAFGYSSWNSWQFEKIAAQLPVKQGDQVFIFSMTNDYTPSYESSTVKSLVKFVDAKDEDRPLPNRSFLADYINQSFFANRIFPHVRSILNAWSEGDVEVKSPKSNVLFKSNAPACKSIAGDKGTTSDQMLDYLMLSQGPECWTSAVRESVDLNIEMLRKVKYALERYGAKVHILMVPAGWALKNQNTVGRIASPYSFPHGVEVGEDGLIAYATEKGLRIDDLRTTLSKKIYADDSLYFAVDGHWTSLAHRIVYNHLKNNYLQ